MVCSHQGTAIDMPLRRIENQCGFEDTGDSGGRIHHKVMFGFRPNRRQLPVSES
jgi:hypothetical protein